MKYKECNARVIGVDIQNHDTDWGKVAIRFYLVTQQNTFVSYAKLTEENIKNTFSIFETNCFNEIINHQFAVRIKTGEENGCIKCYAIGHFIEPEWIEVDSC